MIVRFLAFDRCSNCVDVMCMSICGAQMFVFFCFSGMSGAGFDPWRRHTREGKLEGKGVVRMGGMRPNILSTVTQHLCFLFFLFTTERV